MEDIQKIDVLTHARTHARTHALLHTHARTHARSCVYEEQRNSPPPHPGDVCTVKQF